MKAVITLENGIFFKAVLNDEEPKINQPDVSFRKSTISGIALTSEGLVILRMTTGEMFACTMNDPSAEVIVDTVAGVVPSNNQDLYDKISTLVV